MAKIAINGFGRIGRLFFRQAFGASGIDIVAINDLGDVENLAYLLQYDTVYRTYDKKVSWKKNQDGTGELIVGGKHVRVVQEKDPTKLPWRALGIDVVVESTGIFESFYKAAVHTSVAGAKRVVISAPAKDNEGEAGGKTALVGVNDDVLKTCKVSSNGSCTTNATAPVVAIMNDSVGIMKAMMSTTHGYTATQNLVDGPTKGSDFRRGRAAAQNIVPSTTGAAISVTRAIEELKEKFDGVAIRVPVITVSLIDLTFVSKRNTTVEEINTIFEKASQTSRWKGILGVTRDQVVSSDIIGMPYAAVVDLGYTKVVGGNLVKVFAWYDNEWGYVTTLVEHVRKAVETL